MHSMHSICSYAVDAERKERNICLFGRNRIPLHSSSKEVTDSKIKYIEGVYKLYFYLFMKFLKLSHSFLIIAAYIPSAARSADGESNSATFPSSSTKIRSASAIVWSL